MSSNVTTTRNNIEPVYVQSTKRNNISKPLWLIAIMISITTMLNFTGMIMFFIGSK